VDGRWLRARSWLALDQLEQSLPSIFPDTVFLLLLATSWVASSLVGS
jgi:hypothetical protein